MATVPRLFPGATVVCVGTGPSLRQADVDACRGKARVIVINNAYKIAPWADVMMACDSKFWHWHRDAAKFAGLKYALTKPVPKEVTLLRNAGERGLELKPDGVRTGHNSGYQAINLAVHLGAKRIVLLGYDMRGDHYFGSHPDRSTPPFMKCLHAFPTLVEPLKAIGVEVVNCSRDTALTCFPRAALDVVLAKVAA